MFPENISQTIKSCCKFQAMRNINILSYLTRLSADLYCLYAEGFRRFSEKKSFQNHSEDLAKFRGCKRWSTRCEAQRMGKKSLLKGSQDVQDNSRTDERAHKEKRKHAAQTGTVK